VVRIESMAGIWSFRLNFVKNVCLNYYSRNLVLFNFHVDNVKSSNELPWISIWRLVKLHHIYCVDILKARWLRPAFAESYWLLRVTLSKEVVTVHVWNAPDQWHNWRVAGVCTAFPCQAKCKNPAPTQWRSSIACRPWISVILPPLHPTLCSITAKIFLWTLLAVQKCVLRMLMREKCHCNKYISTGLLTFCKVRQAIKV